MAIVAGRFMSIGCCGLLQLRVTSWHGLLTIKAN